MLEDLEQALGMVTKNQKRDLEIKYQSPKLANIRQRIFPAKIEPGKRQYKKYRDKIHND